LKYVKKNKNLLTFVSYKEAWIGENEYWNKSKKPADVNSSQGGICGWKWTLKKRQNLAVRLVRNSGVWGDNEGMKKN